MTRLNLGILISWLVCLMVACNKPKENKRIQENFDSLKLFEIISYARSHWPNTDTSYTNIKNFDDFDFCRFLPVEHATKKKYKIEGFYNSKKEIIKIYKSSVYPYNDFEFKVLRNTKSNYTIMFVENIFEDPSADSQHEPINGFILIYKNRCYFIGFTIYPFCIMDLDRDLRAKRTLRFCSSKLIYRTSLNYHGENFYSDSLYAPLQPFILSNQTLFSDIEKEFGDNVKFKYERVLKIGRLDAWADLALWNFGGRHEYELQLTPSYEILPDPDLQYNCFLLPQKKTR